MESEAIASVSSLEILQERREEGERGKGGDEGEGRGRESVRGGEAHGEGENGRGRVAVKGIPCHMGRESAAELKIMSIL